MGRPDPQLETGTLLGRYEIRAVLGSGGMGAVYDAIHTGLDKRVALKTLHSSLSNDSSLVTRFLREGKTASRIRHPHVVDVTDVGESDGIPFLVMEFLEGEDLGEHVARVGPLEAEDMLDIMLPALSAVAAAHDADIVHRDLKPDNVFITKGVHGEPFPKILDFGISKVVGGDSMAMTGTQMMLGTPYYMAPEQFDSSRNVTARSDQYSLGVIMYECLTGRRPFEGESLIQLVSAIGRGQFAAPTRLEPSIPAGVEEVVVRAMSLVAAERFASVRELGQALLPFAREQTRARWADELSHERPLELVDSHAATLASQPPPAPGTAPSRADSTPTVASGRPHSPTPTPTERAETLQEWARERTDTFTPAPVRRRWTLGVAAAVGLAALIGGGWAAMRESPVSGDAPEKAASAGAGSTDSGERPGGTPVEPRPEEPEPDTYTVTVDVDPPEAELELDGVVVGTGKLEHELPRDGQAHTLRVSARGHAEQSFSFRDAPPPRHVTLEPLPETKATRPRIRRRPRRPTRPTEPNPRPTTRTGANQAPILE